MHCPHVLHTSVKEAGRATNVEVIVEDMPAGEGYRKYAVIVVRVDVRCALSICDLPQELALAANQNQAT